MRVRGPLVQVFLPISLLLAIYSAHRVIFWWANAETFPNAPFAALIGGIRFDLSAIAWLNIPWFLLVLLAPQAIGVWGSIQRIVFLLINGIGFFFNCVDLAYFSFTLKRSTADLFGIATGGSDLAHLLPVFLQDYWYVVLVFSASLVTAWFGYRWIERQRSAEAGPRAWLGHLGWRLVAITMVVVGTRGGLQLIPISVMDASAYAPPAYMPLVLNTPFTLLKSIGKPVVEEKLFMSQVEADRIWPVVHQYGDLRNTPAAMRASQPNVVVIVLESFSAAYSTRLTGRADGCMPFLDSLMDHGMNFPRAYANGRRSIDGIPAIFASMPKLMDEAFITSPYATTPFTSLASELADKGYHTAFFHAGHNGTMGFDAFCKSAGFQEYVGRNEYPDSKDDDLVWGIWDRPFFRFFADQLDTRQQPFMAGFFSLTSHHPYQLPKEEMDRFPGGDHAIMRTLRYTDDAMRSFFTEASSKPWFRNTLFVITADHTADLERNGEESGSAFDHWIPLVYYMPSVIQPESIDRTTQQIDIMPTVLDLLGQASPFFSFGSSALREERFPAATVESSATYLMITDHVQLRTDGNNVLWSSEVKAPIGADSLQRSSTKADVDAALWLARASAQQFNQRLLEQQLVVPQEP